MEFKKHFSKKRFSLRQVIGMLTAVIVGGAALAYASSVTIPYTFTSGSTASSSEVNANFQALANAINNRTDATLANMAGTWSYNSFGSWLNGNPPNAGLCVTATNGTITLNTDGTSSIFQDVSTNLCISSSAGSATYPNTGGTIPGTWTVLADGSGTLTLNGKTYPFQASRDLNTFVATDESNGSSSELSITAVKQ